LPDAPINQWIACRRPESSAPATTSSLEKIMAVPKNLNLVGPQLQKLRNHRHWSQNQLSKKLCAMGWRISRDILAQMEVTQRRVTDCDLVFLAEALDVSVTNLFPPRFTPKAIRARIQSRRLICHGSKPARIALRTGRRKTKPI
jgi:transcriptional regulator with XRE-family HTH domain